MNYTEGYFKDAPRTDMLYENYDQESVSTALERCLHDLVIKPLKKSIMDYLERRYEG